MKSNNGEQLEKVTKKINSAKKAYVTPKLVNHGSIEKITIEVSANNKNGPLETGASNMI